MATDECDDVACSCGGGIGAEGSKPASSPRALPASPVNAKTQAAATLSCSWSAI